MFLNEEFKSCMFFFLLVTSGFLLDPVCNLNAGRRAIEKNGFRMFTYLNGKKTLRV